MGISTDQEQLLWKMHQDYVQSRDNVIRAEHHGAQTQHQEPMIQENFVKTSMHPSETRILHALMLMSIGCIIYGRFR